MLIVYQDTMVIIELLKYGFPIEFQGDANDLKKVELWKNRNQKGAENFPSEITSYLGKEKASNSRTF